LSLRSETCNAIGDTLSNHDCHKRKLMPINSLMPRTKFANDIPCAM
jgi:hypothetical protein